MIFKHNLEFVLIKKKNNEEEPIKGLNWEKGKIIKVNFVIYLVIKYKTYSLSIKKEKYIILPPLYLTLMTLGQRKGLAGHQNEVWYLNDNYFLLK